MLLLALDTSTRQASIALCTEDEVLGEYAWHVGNNHSVELLDRIQRISGESGKALSELDAVAVATGPGSFNGVRVALATAKSLAFALHKPLVGVSTLDVIAAQQEQWGELAGQAGYLNGGRDQGEEHLQQCDPAVHHLEQVIEDDRHRDIGQGD